MPSLSERYISTTHSHSMNDVIYTKMQRKIEDIIGKYLVEMTIKAQVQLLYLSREYVKDSKELFLIIMSLQICPK